MSKPPIASFEEFWPFYVGEHADKTNRTLHFVGLTLGWTSMAIGLVTGRKALMAAAPVIGYGCAWVGHFLIEKNKPASFKYPLYSFMGDHKMWWMIATGAMDQEVDRVVREREAIAAAEKAAETGVPLEAQA